MHDLCVHMTVCVCLHTRVALLSCVCVVAVFSRRTHTPRHTHTAAPRTCTTARRPSGSVDFPAGETATVTPPHTP
jgi:hypothetical protein